MKKNYYELTFKVTETLQNGKERRVNKTVLSPIFRDGKFIIESERIEKGIMVLKEEHYYNIEYLGIKKKTILWTE